MATGETRQRHGRGSVYYSFFGRFSQSVSGPRCCGVNVHHDSLSFVFRVNMNSNQTEGEGCDTEALYGPGQVVTPTPLLWLAVVHNICIAIFGILGNAVALWCVASCTKTRRPVKVLLMSVFVPVLVICVGSRPLVVEIALGLINCDAHRISLTATIAHLFAYSIMAQSELAFIAVIAVVRVAAVWTTGKSDLKMRVAVTLVLSVIAYSLITGIVIFGAVVTKRVEGKTRDALSFLYFFLATLLPVLVTFASYALMIIAVQRNKRRLAATLQQPRAGAVMDQATRAMLAVFISNLVFSLPHSIYHLMGTLPHYYSVIFHILFSAHFVVDPLVFIFANLHHRRRVLDLLAACTQRMTRQLPRPPSRSVSPVTTNSTPLSSVSKGTAG
ncbi:uncharacterized protein LOC126984064 isoform X2 [Eriocheir sinensis]|uniref:uncharacterized protein LOC126984064 isoform X2 n=1 Tax=Eriocheir sinensis TaxID=95602 RepID=UPI0021C9CE56|nr:uncharacterized protein LOC126984064 isoform X2 [Eriocheir sinensis]